jgi:hypothetical protein
LLINIAQPEYRLLHTRVAKICRIYNIWINKQWFRFENGMSFFWYYNF